MKESLIQRSLRHKNEEIERLQKKLIKAKNALEVISNSSTRDPEYILETVKIYAEKVLLLLEK
jgi:hypothetical protein